METDIASTLMVFTGIECRTDQSSQLPVRAPRKRRSRHVDVEPLSHRTCMKTASVDPQVDKDFLLSSKARAICSEILLDFLTDIQNQYTSRLTSYVINLIESTH